MSEENQTPEQPAATETPVEETAEAAAEQTQGNTNEVKLNGYYAFKKGMSSVYDEQGNAIPVTVLEYKPWVVSQIKTKDKDGYEAVQIACSPKKAKNTLASEKGHLKKAGFENGANFVREVRQSTEGVQIGQRVLIDSFEKGDKLKISSRSKGRGFAGVMKRWDFGGGPASHGSRFHRRPGSIGNCTFPGRVMPGRKMPGHFGNEKVTVPHVQVVDVLPEENVLLVKGPVPGARNSIVQLVKE